LKDETVKEVYPGIFQLRIPIPKSRLNHTLSYLIVGSDEHILIDTGIYSEQGLEAFKEQINQIGIQPDSIDTILITHNHPDHYGLAPNVKEMTSGLVAMHEVDWDQAPWRNMGNSKKKSDRDPLEFMKKWYQLHGVPEAELKGPFFPGMDSDSKNRKGSRKSAEARWDPSSLPKPDLLLKGTEVFDVGRFSVKTIWTPGHTPGHICFYEESAKVIFTGDHILPKITPNVSVRNSKRSDPLADYIDSVNKLKNLDVDWVFPAHEYEFTDLEKRLDDLLEHHESRVQEIVDAVQSEPHSAYQVASNVGWNVGDWKDMDKFLRRSATGETLSHLEYLKNKKRLSSVKDSDGIVRWFYSNT